MGAGLTSNIRRLLEDRKLIRFRATKEMIFKELEGAKYDLERACKSFKDGDYKWATVQAYYSMFHAARALLYSRGFREKSHRALLIALIELFVKSQQLDRGYVEDLRNAMDLREEADYGMVFSEEGAREVANKTRIFIDRVEIILRDLNVRAL
jgi:uncharacterized protein (UPF0332 family)